MFSRMLRVSLGMALRILPLLSIGMLVLGYVLTKPAATLGEELTISGENANFLDSDPANDVGSGAVGKLEIYPSSLNFGSQKLNSTSTSSIAVQNVGSVAVTISGITVIGSGFSFSNLSPGLTIAPNQRVMLQVLFRPVSTGVTLGKLTILSNDLTSPAYLPLAGNSAIPSASAASAVAKATMPAVATAAATPATTATSSSNPVSVQLQWKASPSTVIGYRVYKSAVTGGPYADQVSSPVSGLSYVDTNVTAGATYYYVVTSLDSTGVESKFSNEASAITPGTAAPSPPPSTSIPTSPTAGIVTNGSAALNGTRLRLTSTGANLTGSGWFASPVNVQTFSNDFTFQIANTTTNPIGNGLTFVIQNTGTKALGPEGGGLGYGPDSATQPSASVHTPIAKSVAIKFDNVNNSGEGLNSTGLYTKGASPTTPSTTLGGGVNLSSGDIFKVHMGYDGAKLTMTITDTQHTAQTYTASWTINIPTTVGGNTAYVGFTGATGHSVANQDIISWTYTDTTSQTTSKTPIVYRSTSLQAVSSGPTFRAFV